MTPGVIRALLAVVVLAGGAPRQTGPRQHPVVVFETAKGAIELEVDAIRAPATAANFLKYVDGGFYDGGSVNRAVRPDNTVRHDVEIQVIQFQMDAARRREQFPPVALERTSVTGLKHADGTISTARSSRPDTATASFSIVIGDQPEMDFGGRRSPDGQDSPPSASSSVAWTWSGRFRHRRQASAATTAPSRSIRRSGS